MLTRSPDESRPPRRGFAYASMVVLLLYWLALITATHIPKVPEPLGFRPSDKLLHFAAYAMLGALVGLVCSRFQRPRLWLAGVLLVGLAAHAMVDEATQPLFGRHADAADWLADVLGAATGLAVVLGGAALLQAFWNRTNRASR